MEENEVAILGGENDEDVNDQRIVRFGKVWPREITLLLMASAPGTASPKVPTCPS
jgi:hypothetical protein